MSTDVASFMVTEMGQKGINNDKKKVRNRKENVCVCGGGGGRPSSDVPTSASSVA